MQTNLTIQGMHCDACKALIRMELEDNGFEDKITSLELKDDHKGELVIEVENDEQLKKAKSIINELESYQVID